MAPATAGAIFIGLTFSSFAASGSSQGGHYGRRKCGPFLIVDSAWPFSFVLPPFGA